MSKDRKRLEASTPFLILLALVAWLGGNLISITQNTQNTFKDLEHESAWLETINRVEKDLNAFLYRLSQDGHLDREAAGQLKTVVTLASSWRDVPAPSTAKADAASTLLVRLQNNAADLASRLGDPPAIVAGRTILPNLQALVDDLAHLEAVHLALQKSALSPLAEDQPHSILQIFFITLVTILLVLMLENLFAGRIRGHLMTLRDSLLNLNQNQLNLDSKVSLELQVWESIFYPLPKIAHLFNCFLERHKDIHQKIRLSAVNCENAAMLIRNCHRELYQGTRVQANAADETSTSILQMTATLNEIGNSTESLAHSTDESFQSIQEMDQSINNISERSEELFALTRNSSSSIHDMVRAIGMIRENLNSLANSVESTTSAAARISHSIKEVEGLAKESAALSQKSTIDTSEEGVTAVQKAIAAMHRIQGNVEQTDSLVATLMDRSEQIGEILGVIDEVAEQTSLLALNAAIIASQAGEHGKGFSVVADQIKALAERTVSSIDQIEKVIGDVQSETKTVSQAVKQNVELVEEGVGLSEKTHSALTRILKQSQKASEMSWKIESAAIGQVKSIAHINEDIQNINQRVRQITASVEEQDKGGAVIDEMLERINDFARALRRSMEEESKGTGRIAAETENAFAKIKKISRSIQEHRGGSELIARSIQQIQVITDENIHLTDDLSLAVSTLELHNDELQKEVQSFETVHGRKALTIGISPLVSEVKMQIRFTPLAHYLENKLQIPVRLRVAKDLDSAVHELGAGLTDIAFLTPSTYLLARQKYGCQVLLKGIRDNQPFYHSAIGVREGAPIHTLSDLKGRTFGFCDRGSTSGYLVPKALLRRGGIELTDLREYRFLGHHDDVAWAIVNGEVEAGGLLESLARKFAVKGLRILETSEPIPEFNFSASPELSGDLQGRITEALLQLNAERAEDQVILKSLETDYDGFVPASDMDYAEIEKLMEDGHRESA